MNTDGTNKQRLSYFNDSKQHQYITKGYAIDMSFSADGSQMVSYVQTDLRTQEGKIYLFSFGISDSSKEKDKCVIYPNLINKEILQ